MAWYDIFLRREEDVEKLNPIQQYLGQATETSREYTQNYETYYETLEIVNRGSLFDMNSSRSKPARTFVP